MKAGEQEIEDDARRVAIEWLDMADGAEGADQLKSLTRLILGVRSAGLAAGRAEAFREAADLLDLTDAQGTAMVALSHELRKRAEESSR